VVKHYISGLILPKQPAPRCLSNKAIIY